jgi:hypothetical protein
VCEVGWKAAAPSTSEVVAGRGAVDDESTAGAMIQETLLPRGVPESQLNKRTFLQLENLLPTATILPSAGQNNGIRQFAEPSFGYLRFPRRPAPVVRADVAQQGSLLQRKK